MGGESGWGCGRATHHRAAPPGLFGQIQSFQTKIKIPCNSWRHPEMALMTSYTRTLSNNFLQDLCMAPSHKTPRNS